MRGRQDEELSWGSGNQEFCLGYFMPEAHIGHAVENAEQTIACMHLELGVKGGPEIQIH